MILQRTSQRIIAGQPVKVVVYGDSISEAGRTPGYFGGATCLEMNWADQLGALLRREYPGAEFVVEHFGIGGQNAYEGLGRLDWLPPYAPDLVLVEFGANDCGYHYQLPEETGAAISQLVEGIIVRYQVDVVVMGMGGENPLTPCWQHPEETLAATRAAAEARSVPYVDVRDAILRVTDNGRKWEEFHNGKQDCHPNDQGHAVWAQAVMDVLRRHIQVTTPV